MNKYKDIIKDFYDNSEEERRFLNSRGTNVEFLTTMKYIGKYIKKESKVLEIGAGTGAYSVRLAKMGYDITSIELVESNLNKLKQSAAGLSNIIAEQGDALDLSRFEDNTFDLVLCLGPLYHLYNEQDKMQAINEAIRVCKKGGVIMFAYLTHTSIVWNYGIKKQKFDLLAPALESDGKIRDIPEEVFSSFFVEDFIKQFEDTNTTFLHSVASDGLAGVVKDWIDALSDEQYEMFLKWHYSTCERFDQQGVSAHMLYICKKN